MVSRVRQTLVGGATFSVALGIGFVMQNGDALAARFTNEAPTASGLSMPQAAGDLAVAAEPHGIRMPDDVAVSHIPSDEVTGPAPALAAAVVLPAEVPPPVMELPPVQLAALGDDAILNDVMPDTGSSNVVAAPDCEVSLQAETGAAAMVELTLDAPCAPETAVTIHHQGMMFTIMTDAEGTAQVEVPALAEVSVFLAAFETGPGAAATTMVPELIGYDRAVLQWQGANGLELHALEFGAAYGEAGHVWAEAARDTAIIDSGTGGYMTRLGDVTAPNPLIAEVYTFSSNSAAQDGQIDLSVEIEVTETNCGRDISAQSIQISPDALPSALDLTMTLPGCDAVGEFLVLNAMLHNVVVAAN